MEYHIVLVLASVAILSSCVSGLEENDTHVYTWAFMDVTTDSVMQPYQHIHVGTFHERSIRLQMPDIGLNYYYVMYSPTIPTPSFLEIAWTDELSHNHEEETSFNAMRLVADGEVGLVGNKATRGSTDSFLALPLTVESTTFFIPSYYNVPQGHSSFMVVSAYKDTCVEAAFVNGSETKRIFFKSLGEFEVYQTYAMDLDYTGVFVNATRPVSVIGGHECAQVPRDIVFCDHLVAQIPPVSEWGTEFIVGPISGRNQNAGYVIRVIAGFDGTMVTAVTQSGASLLTAKEFRRGNYEEITVTNSLVSAYIVCSIKCLVVQYNTGYFMATGRNDDTPTDPFMTLITPMDHFVNHVAFSTSEYWSQSGPQPFASYLTLVVKTAAKSGIRLNDATLSTFGSTWVDNVANTGFSVITFPLEHGNYTAHHQDDLEKFAGYCYGHSRHDPTAYGYGIGYDIQGSALPGDWWDIVLGKEPEPPASCQQLRVPPPVDVRGPFQQFTVRGILRNEATSADCYDKYQVLLGPKLRDLKQQINQLICQEHMCPNTEYTHITTLEVAGYNPANTDSQMKSFDLNVEMVTSLDETIGDLVICKRQVIAFLLERYNWEVPISVINCPDFDLGDLFLLGQMYQCRAPQ